jgi:hypothetical protein
MGMPLNVIQLEAIVYPKYGAIYDISTFILAFSLVRWKPTTYCTKSYGRILYTVSSFLSRSS